MLPFTREHRPEAEPGDGPPLPAGELGTWSERDGEPRRPARSWRYGCRPHDRSAEAGWAFRQKALGPQRPFGTRYSFVQTSPRAGERATRGSGSKGRRCKPQAQKPTRTPRCQHREGFLAGGGTGCMAGRPGDEQLPQSRVGVVGGLGLTPQRKKMALRVWKRVENRHWRSHSSLADRGS